MAGYYNHRTECKNCGKVTNEEKFTYAYEGHPEQNQIKEYCWDCKQSFIGTRQSVIRYGNVPKSGVSFNYRDNESEIGVSCYLPKMRPRPEFTHGRNKLEFTAIVIGYGGDDEPLIDAKTIK